MTEGIYPIITGSAAHVSIYVYTALCIGIILNCNFAATSNEVSLTSSSSNNIQAVKNFRKFGINIYTLKHFPIEENGAFKTINVIERLDAINSTGVLMILGTELLGEDYDIDHVFDSTVRERIVLKLFQRWLHREGTEPVTCRGLADALLHSKIAMKDLSKKIFSTCELYHVLDSPCKPKSFLLYALNVSDEYRKSCVIENEKLWLPTRLPRQRIQFVPLEFRDVQTDFNISISDIFSSNIKTNSKVLFTGRPGSGKSTLTRYLAKELVTKDTFDMVIRVHLGTIRKLDSLVTLLQVATTIEFPSTIINTTASYIRATQGNNICFLLDGYDEYLPADSSDYIHRLILKSVLRESTIVLTSRPKAVEDIKSNFYLIEVLGFGDVGIQLYLQHFNASAVEYIYQYFALHPNIHQLCHLPLHLSMIAYIATDPVDTGTLSIVNTETLLYSNFFSLTVKQYEKANNKTVNMLFECYKNANKLDNFCTLLHRISEISFEGVLERKLTFTIRDFDGLPSSINVSVELKGLGLFKVEKIYDRSGADLEKYSYAHPTFQEFLGAFHLAIIAQYSQTDFLKFYWTHEMYKFALGLMSTKLKYDSNIVLSSFISYGRTILATYQNQELYIMKCAHELGDSDLFIQSLKEVDVIDKNNSVQLFTFDRLDCWYIGYLLTQSPILELGIDTASDLDLCVSYLTKYLRLDSTSNESVRVKQLRLGHEASYYWPYSTKLESDIHISELVGILPLLSNDLTYLGLREVTLEHGESIMHIGNILKSFEQLKSVDLSLNASLIQEGYLNKALKNITQLEHLELGLANEYDEDTIIPDDMFEHLDLKNINNLGIHSSWNKKLVDVNLTAVVGGLRHMTHLKKLSIKLTLYDGLRTNGVEELLTGIKMLPGITDLELDLDLCWDTGLGHVTIQELVRMLKGLSLLLKKLTLCISYIFSGIVGSAGVVELSEGLKSLSHLHSLNLELRWEIEDTADVDESTAVLSDSLKQLHKLDSLQLNLQHNGRLNKLAITFKSLTQLKEIDLKWTQPGGQIGETDVPQLLADLATLTALTKLDLSWNTLTDQDIPSLIQALKNMPDLKTLDLSNNQIGDDEMSHLVDTIVRRLPNFEVLLLNHNNITKVGATILSDKLKHCTKLHKLDLDLEIGNYSVQVLLPKQSVSFNNDIKVELDPCYVDWHGKVLLELIVAMATSLISAVYIVSKLRINWNRKHKKFSLASALATTSSSWRLDKLYKYDLDGTYTVIVILDTAIHPNCPICDFDQIDVREDLPSLPSVFQNLSSDLLPSEWSVFHGSICALVAAGSPDKDPLIPRGVAPKAKVLIYRISNGEKNDDAQRINKAVLKALREIKKKMLAKMLRIDVVSISYDLDDDENVEDIKDLITELTEMGVIFVAAAGNDGLFRSKAAIPARFNEVICVGSLNKYGNRSEFDLDIPKIDIRALGELNIPGMSKEVKGSSYAAPAIGGVVLLLIQLANDIGPPASSKIHSINVIKHILSEYITTSSYRDGNPITDPVEFLIDVAVNHDRLQEIIEKVQLDDQMELN